MIRGPGAALWGANAVNGVINIITKHAADTQGGLLSTGFGSEEKAFGSYRYGGEFGDDGYYRAFVKSFSRDGLANADGSDANDDWQINRAGLRADWRTRNGSEVSLQGEIYEGTTSPTLKVLNDDTKEQELLTNQSRDQKGGHLIGNYKRYLNDGSHISVKGYYDRYENYDYRVTEKRDVADLEFQHQMLPLGNHDIIWGLGYRFTHYNLTEMNHVSTGDPDRTDQLFTGFEVQPNASLTWKISDQQTLWFKAASAVKTPSISETSVTSRGIAFIREEERLLSDGSIPELLAITGNENLESENLFALEVGYREQFNNRLLFDITAFFNQYRDLLAYVDYSCLDGTEPNPSPSFGCFYTQQQNPAYELSSTFANGLTANTYGVELTTDWQATPWWKLQFNYSFLSVDAFSESTGNPLTDGYLKGNEELLETLSADHTANIRSHMNLPNQWYLDFWVRYMDNLEDAKVGSYTALDVRVAKKFGENLEISLTGQNLFDKQRLEFSEIFSGLGETEVQQAWYLQLRWQH